MVNKKSALHGALFFVRLQEMIPTGGIEKSGLSDFGRATLGEGY